MHSGQIRANGGAAGEDPGGSSVPIGQDPGNQSLPRSWKCKSSLVSRDSG